MKAKTKRRKAGRWLMTKVCAERDALRAQLAAERERMEKWLTAPDGKRYERGTVQDVFDELDALRAQVEAARACLNNIALLRGGRR